MKTVEKILTLIVFKYDFMNNYTLHKIIYANLYFICTCSSVSFTYNYIGMKNKHFLVTQHIFHIIKIIYFMFHVFVFVILM